MALRGLIWQVIFPASARVLHNTFAFFVYNAVGYIDNSKENYEGHDIIFNGTAYRFFLQY